jgi:16S rRNA (guanine966-N2)-methyltransferase
VRIISGSLKGRRFNVRSGSGVRPTSERVRESLFSVIGNSVKGTVVLDLFSGTGALGIEALSRGAKSVTLVEKDRKVFQNLYSLCSTLNILDQATVMNMDAIEAIELLVIRQSKFDMIFLDPPYDSDWIPGLFCKDLFLDLVAPNGFIVVETGQFLNSATISRSCAFEEVFSRMYGSSLLQIFRSLKPEVNSNTESNQNHG